MNPSPPFDEEDLLLNGKHEGKHIGVRLPRIDANHLLQMAGGSGRTRTRESGK